MGEWERPALPRPERSIPAKSRYCSILSRDDDDNDDNDAQVLPVPDSKAPQQCLVGPYSVDDVLRRDGIPRHHLDP